MKKLNRTVLLYLLFFTIGQANAKVYTIVNNGYSFSPAITTIKIGDTVKFQLASMHNAVQVSKSTWNSNSNLSNGFQLDYGGGTVVLKSLDSIYYSSTSNSTLHKTGVSLKSVDTIYFVCQPHASMGMKGRVIVTDKDIVPATVSSQRLNDFRLFPNPAKDIVNIELVNLSGVTFVVNIYDILGQLIQSNTLKNANGSIQLSVNNLKSGKYLVKVYANGLQSIKTLIIQ